jgi:hypothetical protein
VHVLVEQQQRLRRAPIWRRRPSFEERYVESGNPGELLSADTFMVGTLKGIGRAYLDAVVDSHGGDTFSFPQVSKQPGGGSAAAH